MAELAEIIKTTFQVLYTVTFLHNGYGLPVPGSISDNIRLNPDKDTQTIFLNHHIGYRFFNDLLVVFMRASNPDPTIPFLKISRQVRFRFFMHVSTDFLHRTQVDAVGSLQVYQFSNKVNAGTGGFLSMHTEGVNMDDLKPVDEAEPGENCFAVMDVYNNGAINNAYDLFSGVADSFNSPGYFIRFISTV